MQQGYIEPVIGVHTSTGSGKVESTAGFPTRDLGSNPGTEDLITSRENSDSNAGARKFDRKATHRMERPIG